MGDRQEVCLDLVEGASICKCKDGEVSDLPGFLLLLFTMPLSSPKLG